ncbi:MAG: double-strand break repair protein AddB, partial [Paracoccus sp. (in: a-proteobacteria)]
MAHLADLKARLVRQDEIKDAVAVRDEIGRAVTLIAADGNLIRRVNSALDRWHLRADESAGQPMPLTPQGLFLRQIAGIFGEALTIDRLLSLLKHPLAVTGSTLIGANEARLAARELELHLRRNGPAFPDGDSLRSWADRGDETRRIWARWLAVLLDRMAGFATDSAPRPLAARLAELRALAEDFAAGPGGDPETSRLWAGSGGALARAVLDNLAEHAGHGPDMGPADFAALLFEELQSHQLRNEGETCHLLQIRGTREARILNTGTVILSGLNEGGWPQALDPDPWLSRDMRAAAGLTLPERLIGLAAHDFQQAIGAETVILTRARRDAEAETIPSRWLNRLTNLMAGLPERRGPEALAAMRDRGRVWLDLARAVTQPETAVPAAPRPSPLPPAPAFADL